MAELPFEVTWLDSRFDGFPSEIPDGVRHVVAPRLADKVDDAPPATLFLVLTHSHQLDLDICDRVLRRGDSAFLGLIGSATKKARFLSALKGRGHGAPALERLVCPIGLAQVPGKQPMAIAVSTAAQLLALPAAENAGAESQQSTGNRRGAG
jgi:xanthine dehydrogenase accessory factor